MSGSQNIAFIGARGVGKSTIAKLVAHTLEKPLFCMDELIQYEAHGRSIEQIVEEENWTGFRDLELLVLEKLAKCQGAVIDCGGGVLVEAPEEPSMKETFSERKHTKLQECAKVIYLKRPLEELVSLVELDANRPKLSDDYKMLLEQRLPWYEKAADHTIELADLSTVDVKNEVLKLV